MIKRKKITATILTSVILSAIYFFSNYRIFFSPFEILSNKTIEQNLQGICVDEGRKLSKEELLARGMTSYFKYLSQGRYYDDMNSEWREYCPVDGACWLTSVGKASIAEYIFDSRKRKFLNQDEGKKILFSNSGLLFLSKNNPKINNDSFYSVIENSSVHFFPYKCCNINDRRDLTEDDFPFSGVPNYLEERGLGSYFLNTSSLHIGKNNNLTYINKKYILSNCGDYLPEKYSVASPYSGTYEMKAHNELYIPYKNFEIYKKYIFDLNICSKWVNNNTPLYKVDISNPEEKVIWDGQYLFSCNVKRNQK